MFKVKAEPLGPVATTKKGAFVRKFLVLCADGKKDVLSIWSKESAPLDGDGVREMTIRPGDMVFAD